MDWKSECDDDYDYKPPPPSYSNMEDIPLYEDIQSPPPPPIETPATPPPAYQENNNPQAIPQNSYTGGTNSYPILIQPNQMQMVREQQVVMQQTSSSVAPQVIVVQPQQTGVLDDTPTPTTCKYCLQSITTHVDYKPGFTAWAMCLLICFLGGFCGFCLIPFFVRGFQDAYHSCPSCKRHLGLYTRK